jgi:hypothetical protein
MARFEQYEVWVLPEGESSRWEMAAAFPDFEVASAVAMNRKSRVRLLHCVYEDRKLIEKHVLADLGDVQQAS